MASIRMEQGDASPTTQVMRHVAHDAAAWLLRSHGEPEPIPQAGGVG